MKSNFFKRLFAFLLDIMIVAVLVGACTFFIPESENSKNLSLERENLTSDFFNKKVSAKEFTSRALEISYDDAKEEVLITIISIGATILYFVVFEAYNNGQTIGKKLVKLKITSTEQRELNLNDYLKRLLIVPPILINLFDLILLLVTPKRVYLTSNVILNILQLILLIITGIMVIYRKDGRGLHDIIAKTKVIEVNGDV